MNVLRLSLSLTLLPLLLAGCASAGRRPAAYTPGQSLAFLGLHDAQGQPVKNAAVDSDAIATDLRARAPDVRWVDAAVLDQPLRRALVTGWTPPDIWISGRLDTNEAERVEWAWHRAAQPDLPIFYQVTYPSGLTTTNAVDSLIEGFALRPPPPPPAPAPEVEPVPEDGQEGPRVLGVKDGAVRARSAGLKPGRYYARGPQEVFENPISGEKTVISRGAVLGLVEFETISGRTATGRLLEGEAPEGARLEAVE